MEKHSEGGCTFRGRRAEDKEAARFAQEKQRQMERLYTKIENDYEEKENKTGRSMVTTILKIRVFLVYLIICWYQRFR